ncbi:PBAN-type neuropeptides-like isoform X2 [Wyeomyia smithii]|uniref:PBAN-type neuropeptides-like isoform X2 n=1 Tax=Wyeomyia smithii TaxID=174621 RepID=UPI00246800D6|nr:PBAN-type neuropeptides-like isoform X2 [Wyeomyia smithii]
MFKFYFFFNVVCIYLAIRSALAVEIPDPNKMSSYFSAGSHDDEAPGKRATAMWFGPRLGKRTIPQELQGDMMDEIDSNPLFYIGESPYRLASQIAQGSPYVVLLATKQPLRSQPIYYSPTAPRLGRRDTGVNENYSRPPFAPRLGRNLPMSPRLGRSSSAAEDLGY